MSAIIRQNIINTLMNEMETSMKKYYVLLRYLFDNC